MSIRQFCVLSLLVGTQLTVSVRPPPTPDSVFRPFQCGSNQYQALNVILGYGNYGRIYEGHVAGDSSNKVAIKLYKRGDYPGWEEEFMGHFDHPSIPKLYDGCTLPGQQEGTVVDVLVMEYAGSTNLQDYIWYKSDALQHERSVKFMGYQLAQAVAYLHSVGVIHMDIKTSNIVIKSIETEPYLMINGVKTLIDLGPVNPKDDPHAYPVVYLVDYGYSERHDPTIKPESYHRWMQYSHLNFYSDVDVWCLGKVLAETMAGTHLHGSCRDKKYRRIEEMNLTQLSQPAIKFITTLMTKDAQHRVSMEEVIRHSWLPQVVVTPLTQHVDSTNGSDETDAVDAEMKGVTVEDELTTAESEEEDATDANADSPNRVVDQKVPEKTAQQAVADWWTNLRNAVVV